MAIGTVVLVMAILQFTKGQTCSELDLTLQKTWIPSNVAFTGTTMVEFKDIGPALVQSRFIEEIFECVAESGDFRLYRRDYTVAGTPFGEYKCIQIIDSSQSGFLQIARFDAVDAEITGDAIDICSVCKLNQEDESPVLSLVEEGSSQSPLPKTDLICNMPENCPPISSFDKPCEAIPEESDLSVFCDTLLAILDSKSSEEEVGEEGEGGQYTNVFGKSMIPVIESRRQVWQRRGRNGKPKSWGKSKSAASSGNGGKSSKGKRKGKCNKSLEDEIRANCPSE